MLKKSLLFIFSFLVNVGFSQSEKVLNGKIISQNSSVSNAEIINYRSKIVAVSNEFGLFEISVRPNDRLIVVAKNYFEKNILISSKIISENQVNISIEPKANELKEVTVKSNEKLVPKIEMQQLQRINATATTNRANSAGVYTGETINGMDFIAIGKLIASAFKSKKKRMPKNRKIDFKEYVKSNFNESFFYETLQILPINFSRYLDFCEADPNSQELIRENNEFKVLNFFIEKKTSFDKL